MVEPGFQGNRARNSGSLGGKLPAPNTEGRDSSDLYVGGNHGRRHEINQASSSLSGVYRMYPMKGEKRKESRRSKNE